MNATRTLDEIPHKKLYWWAYRFSFGFSLSLVWVRIIGFIKLNPIKTKITWVWVWVWFRFSSVWFRFSSAHFIMVWFGSVIKFVSTYKN